MLSSSSEEHTLGLASAKCTLGCFVDGLSHGDIAWQSNHCYAATRDRSLDRNLEYARHLRRLRGQLAVAAALMEEIIRMSRLKISTADLSAGNLCRDSENGNAAAVAIIKPID